MVIRTLCDFICLHACAPPPMLKINALRQCVDNGPSVFCNIIFDVWWHVMSLGGIIFACFIKQASKANRIIGTTLQAC